MLSEQQFAAIGRLTLAFNRVEVVIDGYAALLLGTSESSVAEFIVQGDQGVNRKVKLLAGIIKAVLSEHPALAERVEKAATALKKVEPLALRRNEIVHSLVTTDKHGKGALFNKWKKTAPACDVPSLDALTEETEAVATSLVIGCADLERELGAARKDKRRRDRASNQR